MNIMRTVIQLTTTTLATCLLLSIDSGAFATRQVSNSTSNSIEGRSTQTTLDISKSGTYSQYEPDPNGSPKSDGAGTR
ncbi:MAG: hypothetical protein HC789_22255 [Microcoleus sp. CSU_2_2]|nr:hypothetical protein [Microcoleus sp. SU_5_3]NJS12894.1 hypothetical protein [Microcoleus sp. CSU_2_2]